MSQAPNETILVALTFHDEASHQERDAGMEVLYDKVLPSLVKQAPSFKCYRVLTDEDNLADYQP
jgi:hypothetical protein